MTSREARVAWFHVCKRIYVLLARRQAYTEDAHEETPAMMELNGDSERLWQHMNYHDRIRCRELIRRLDRVMGF